MDAVIPLLLVLDAVQMAWVTILFQYVPGMQSNVHLDLSSHKRPAFPPVVVRCFNSLPTPNPFLLSIITIQQYEKNNPQNKPPSDEVVPE